MYENLFRRIHKSKEYLSVKQDSTESVINLLKSINDVSQLLDDCQKAIETLAKKKYPYSRKKMEQSIGDLRKENRRLKKELEQLREAGRKDFDDNG